MAESLARIRLAAMVGTTVEYYDFFVYSIAAVWVFPVLFFPTGNPTTALLASLATFGLAFVARPLGSMLFGHYGDRIGRKSTLLATMTIMGLGTFLIGLLPTYQQIGVAAPILLAVLRIPASSGSRRSAVPSSLRITARSWITVSWVATASNNGVESSTLRRPRNRPAARAVVLTSSNNRRGRSEARSRLRIPTRTVG